MQENRPQTDLPLVHVYQNTEEGHVIFYTMKDKLFFYTLLAILLRRYGIKLVAMSLMPDHYHLLLQAFSTDELRPLARDLNSTYARRFNQSAGISGKVFKGPMGFSVKKGVKERMSAINYVHNNPVVKKLDRRCASSTWNFLAFAKCPYPFSEKPDRSRCRIALRRAMRMVDSLEKNGEWLDYPTLNRLFDPLTKEEKLQLFDYAVSRYKAIDYESAAAYFGSVDNMIESAEMNSGAEYDIDEVFDTRDDRPYLRMAAALLDEGICTKDVKEVLAMNYGTRLDLFTMLRARSMASFRQMEKFLHLHEGTMKAKDAANIIALTGFMGAGKTTVGRELAHALDCPFMDLDEEVGKAAGKPVPTIIREDGEATFRKLEISTLRRVLRRARKRRDNSWDLVLALGGGTIMKSEARSLLIGNSYIIWLKAGAETLLERLSGDVAGRPLLEGNDLPGRINSLLAKREETYFRTADLTVEVDGKDAAATAGEIIKSLHGCGQ